MALVSNGIVCTLASDDDDNGLSIVQST